MLRLPPPPGAMPVPIPGQMAQPGVVMQPGEGGLPDTPTDGSGPATR